MGKKITKIRVRRFRNISGVDLSFNRRLNAIAGQNGTSKTSILGLIGHIFTFSRSEKSLGGKNFLTKFSEIFKFAYPDYDEPGDHYWITEFEDGVLIPALSTERKGLKETKPTIRIKVGSGKKGSSKVDLPVIYLGMSRLFPLSLEPRITTTSATLTESEERFFVDFHNEVLIMVGDAVTTESVKTPRKIFFAPKTDKYNHLGNSAGQDNLGQIITALISFQRLRAKLGVVYEGGILLIDELDASLYPAAQIKLVQKLHIMAKQLDLQIFFTTHSLEVLNATDKLSESGVIFLDKSSSGIITPRYNLDVDELQRQLLVLAPDALSGATPKANLFCEDDEAVRMLKSILPRDVKNLIVIRAIKLSCGELKTLASRKLPPLQNTIFVIDGDATAGDATNVIALPGSKAPDRLMYDFLKDLPESDFSDIKSGYTKQFCFKDLLSLDSSLDKQRLRKKLKAWYQAQKNYWGPNDSKVWSRWKDVNSESVEDFRKLLKRKL